MQARPSDDLGQLAHSTPAPHRRFCRLLAYTTTRYDSFALSDSGQALSVLPR
jgi:hypothetical protein